MDAQDVGGANRYPAPEKLDPLDGMPSVAPVKTPGGGRSSPHREGDLDEKITASPRKRSDVREDIGSSSSPPAPVPAPPRRIATIFIHPRFLAAIFIGSASACGLIL